MVKRPVKKEEWQKVKEIFAVAVEQPAGLRSQFLLEACGEDLFLRREVESLLEASDDPEQLIEKNAFDLAARFQTNGFEGKQFGSYKIIREIGRGGMGAVFLAARTDAQFEQQVALKIIRQALADEEIERHFRRERQILASLNHPNIARLYDGGVSAEGLAYFVMEYIEGEPLLEFAENNRLDVNERLNLFLKICSAVGYAHRHLVVHRDIKPSNILVDREGTPKLLDFGLAKTLDLDTRSNDTETVFRAFTPAYASPEQMRGQNVTTASDVYSLGVCLYELLTERRPYSFKTDSVEEIIHAVCDTDPIRPSRAITKRKDADTQDESNPQAAAVCNPQLLRGDLDNIILKALRKEPERRYATVEQFAGDIERYLKGLPVSARRATFSYRAAKFIERNKFPVMAAALIVLSLVGGLAVSLWQAKIARQERDRAERRFADVRQLSNALLTDIAPKIERIQGATEAREALVTQSLKYLDSLAQESSDDLSLQNELASAYEKVGDIQGNPTNPSRFALNEALTSYEKANEIRRKLLEKNPQDFDQRRLLANNYRVQGDIRWQAKEMTESQKMADAALAIYNELLTEQPDSLEIRIALGQIYLDTGTNLTENQKFAQSIPYFQKAIDTGEDLRQKYPDQTGVLILLANGYQQMGNALSWNGQQKEGEAAMTRAVEIYESLVAAHPNDITGRAGLWQTYLMTASVYEEQNDRLANEYDFKALRIIQETVERDPANVRAKEQMAKTYSHLGVTFQNIGKPAESIAYLEKAAAMLREISSNETKNGRIRQNLATALIRLGDARRDEKDFQNARTDLEQAAAIMTELFNADRTDNGTQKILANATESLAAAYEGLSERAEGSVKQSYRQQAKQNYIRTLEILRELEAKGALAEYDRKLLEKLQATVQKYER